MYLIEKNLSTSYTRNSSPKHSWLKVTFLGTELVDNKNMDQYLYPEIWKMLFSHILSGTGKEVALYAG